MQCGRPLDRVPIADRIVKGLSKPAVIGVLAVVFTLLLAGLVLASGVSGTATSDGAGTRVSTEAGGQVGAAGPNATPTLAVTRPPVIQVPEVIPVVVNESANETPRPLETVLSVHTLGRYIQNAGGDEGNQLLTRTPVASPSPTASTPAPTTTRRAGPIGDLAWAGDGSYVTDAFQLNAGDVRLDLTAEQLTMVQLLDLNRTAIGIATAGPDPGGATIRVPSSGSYRIEVWPFGTGLWTARITMLNVSAPVSTPSLFPTIVETPTPVTTTPTTLPAVSVETTPVPAATETSAVSPAPTEIAIPASTTPPTLTPPPTQVPHTYTGNGTSVTPYFQLLPGVALFTYQHAGNGTFSVTLIDGEGTVTDQVVQVNGTVAGSKAVSIPRQENYLLNVAAEGAWEVSVG